MIIRAVIGLDVYLSANQDMSVPTDSVVFKATQGLYLRLNRLPTHGYLKLEKTLFVSMSTLNHHVIIAGC